MDRAETFMAPIVGGSGLLVLAAVLGHWGIVSLGPWLISFGAIILSAGLGRLALRAHPDEPWVGRLLFWGVWAKILMSQALSLTVAFSYGGVSDATGYDGYGRGFVEFWNGRGPNPGLPDLRETNFIRWFTGVVYYIFGSNFLTGFYVFALLAVIGSYLWYRATVNAVPFIDRRLYMALVMFMPSIVFWPAAIGKEALMQFAIGLMALGTSHLLKARLAKGLVICLAGGWILWVVRPHLLAIVALAGGVGYLVGRVRQKDGKKGSLLSRPVGILVIAVLVSFTVNQGAEFLGLKDLSISSLETRLDDQTQRTSTGGSTFENKGNSLNPLRLPQGLITVILRPFPWETDSALQLLSSAESVLFAGFIVFRLRSIRVSLAQARLHPYLMYCWVLTILYSMAFASFANFGLLVRQRSLVLPALCVLLAVDPDRVVRRATSQPIPARSSSAIR